jgi:hypothetical protein
MLDLNVTSQLLTQLLSIHAPEFGARLKQRLNTLVAERGLGRFDERAFGYRKFHDFLERAHGELIKVERPSETGDILVSLKSPTATGSGSSPAVTAPRVLSHQTPIRSDVWQAFSNPDRTRKRFMNKHSYAVRHFVEGQPNHAYAEISAAPEDFVEIKEIDGATHLEWMKNFLDGIRLPAGERVAFDALLNEPYTSGVNATFTRALGEHSTAWRHFRTKLVVDQITAWARRHAIPIANLRIQLRASTATLAPAAPAVPDAVRTAALSSREQVIKLLDLLTDEDIARLVLPTLLSTILVKSRL